jgi:DNA (cytosine-5)-methyltransferase 1
MHGRIDRPRALDLYCREGGAGQGYRQAGFAEVVGVDTGNHIRRNPGPYLRMNVLDLDVRFIRLFDFVHASPPCQFGTALRHAKGAKGERSKDNPAGHLNLIPATRSLLQKAGVPYVIENVEDVAPHLIDPILLCGTMFDLGCTTSDGTRFHLWRRRVFEASWDLKPPRPPEDRKPVIGIYGAHIRNRAKEHGGRGTVDFPGEDKPALARAAMGMPWATMDGMSEAIPPAFSRYIGEEFLACRDPLDGVLG